MMKNKTNFVVFAISDKGNKVALASSNQQSRAIGYAYMCKHETYIRKCTDLEMITYSKSFHIINLD